MATRTTYTATITVPVYASWKCEECGEVNFATGVISCKREETTSSWRSSKKKEAEQNATNQVQSDWVENAYRIITDPNNNAQAMRSDLFLQNTCCTKCGKKPKWDKNMSYLTWFSILFMPTIISGLWAVLDYKNITAWIVFLSLLGFMVSCFIREPIFKKKMKRLPKEYTPVLGSLNKDILDYASTKGKRIPNPDETIEIVLTYNKTTDLPKEEIHISEATPVLRIDDERAKNNNCITCSYCRKCGAKLPKESAFCNKCGAKVTIKSIHNETPIYVDSLFSINKNQIGKYVQLIGNYTCLTIKKDPLKCNLSQYSLRGDRIIDVELEEPLPDYVVNNTVFERQPIILRGILEKSTDSYHEYVLKNAEYQGYWRDEKGEICCTMDCCAHDCTEDCPIYLNKLGKEKYDEYNRDEAILSFKRAVFLAPDFAEAWCNLGYAYLDSQKYKDAYESFCESEKYKPNNARIMYGAIVSLSKVGRQKEAQDLLEKYQRLFPNKNSETLSKIINNNLLKTQIKSRITDEEYVKLLVNKGFDEFWETIVEEKELTFATQSYKYTGESYRKRCEKLEWFISVYVGEKSEKLFDLRQTLIKDNVQNADSLLLFDVIDEYESRYIIY